MKRAVFLLLLLAGCANQPISQHPLPAEDVAQCQSLSGQHSMAKRALENGTVESARASGVSFGITRLVQALGGHMALSTLVPPIAAGYMVTGAAIGAIAARDRQEAIVRECLRDLGHKVY